MTAFGHAFYGENFEVNWEFRLFLNLQKLRKNDVDTCLIKRWGIGRFCPSMTFRNLEVLPVIWLILPLISWFRIQWKRYALYALAEHQNPLLIISWFAFYEHTWFIRGTLFVISSMATFISRECSIFPMIFPWFSHDFETWDDPFMLIFPYFPIWFYSFWEGLSTRSNIAPGSQASMSRADARQDPVVLSHGSWRLDDFGYPHDLGNLHIHTWHMYFYIYRNS